MEKIEQMKWLGAGILLAFLAMYWALFVYIYLMWTNTEKPVDAYNTPDPERDDKQGELPL